MRERIVAKAGDAARDGNAVQAGAFKERCVSDSGDAARDSDISEATITECIAPDVRDAVGNRDVGQVAAGSEGPILNVCDAAGNRHFGQGPLVSKGRVSNGSDGQ